MRSRAELLPDDARLVLGSLDLRRPFAPSLPARASGGVAVGWAVALLSSLVLILHLSPTAPSGEVAAEMVRLLRDGWTAGTTGPLWSALAVWFEGTGIGPGPIWRVTLLSAAATALTAGLLAVWLRQRDVGRRAAVCAGLLFAFTLPIWSEAVLPSASSLAAMLTMVGLVLVEEGRSSLRRRPRCLGWAFLGLAALQGAAALGGVLAIIALLLPRGRCGPIAPAALSFVGGIALGALAAGGLPGLSALATPATGGWAPPAIADAIVELGLLAGPTGIAALVGLLILWWRHPGDAGGLTLLATIPVGWALLVGPRGGPEEVARELARSIPITFIALAALAGAGIDVVLQRFAATPTLRARLLTATAAALPLAVIGLGAPLANRSGSTTAEEWARSVLRGLPEDTILLTRPDPRGGLLEYTQLIGGVRPDILIADPGGTLDPRRSPLLAIEPATPSSAAEVRAIATESGRPLCALAPLATTAGHWQPWGLIWRWAPLGEASAGESEEAWSEVKLPSLPSRPASARGWIEEELRNPLPDRTRNEIAADYFQALARRDGKLSQIGPWATVLDHLPRLRHGRGGIFAPPSPLSRD